MYNLTEGFNCAIGGFLIHLVLGTLYCFGNLTTYITSYLRKFDNTITYENTLTIYAFALGFQGI